MDKSITLICITNVNHKTSEFAINKTLENVPYIERVVLISDREMNIKHDNADFIDMKQKHFLDMFEIESFEDFGIVQYSNFCIAGFPGIEFNTSHILIVQYDGFATQKEYWDDRFLDYDYLGSLINPDWEPSKLLFQRTGVDEHGDAIYSENTATWQKYKDWGWANGGGGLSLRSKKLIDVLRNSNNIFKDLDNNCEDFVLAMFKREYLEKEYGIKYAPVELCMKWCTELYSTNAKKNYSLGFHGLYLSPLFLTKEESLNYIDMWTNEECKTSKQNTITSINSHGAESQEKYILYNSAVMSENPRLLDWLYDHNIFPMRILPPKLIIQNDQLKRMWLEKNRPKMNNISF